jgi:hypothetical protein
MSAKREYTKLSGGVMAKFKYALLLLLVVSAAQCSSTGYKEQSSETNTLVVGRAYFEITKWSENYDRFVVGKKQYSYLELRLWSLANRKVYKIKTFDGYGNLFSVDLPAGDYNLIAVFIIIRGPYGESWVRYGIQDNRVFQIIDGVVNNIGQFSVIVNFDDKKWEGTHGFGYDELKSDFMENKPESGWNKSKWVNVKYSEY